MAVKDRNSGGLVVRSTRSVGQRACLRSSYRHRQLPLHRRRCRIADCRPGVPPTLPGPCDGFTLLELLIVGVLVSVLMVSVWSLFRTWGRLYERGERRTERAQLVRSLCDQFTDDVHGVAYVAPVPSRWGRGRFPSGSQSASERDARTGGNLALVGGSDWLILEVLQPPNPYRQQAVGDETPTMEPERPSLVAPELQRVMYTFAPPAADLLDGLSSQVEDMAASDDTEQVGDEPVGEEVFSGLLRTVVAHEYFDQLATADASSLSPTSVAGSLREAAFQVRERLTGSTEPDPQRSQPQRSVSVGGQLDDETDDSVGILEQDEVPEVVWLEFRYYDGSSWLSGWDSQSAGRLPVAVEIRFELKKVESPDTKTPSDAETETVEGPRTSSAQNDARSSYPPDATSLGSAQSDVVDSEYEETPYVRCVVYLEPVEDDR